MCGIAGLFDFSAGFQPVDQTTVTRLTEFQRHRRPDGEGLWASDDRRVVPGHRRLAVIETRQLGHMNDTGIMWRLGLDCAGSSPR